jgi:hypothetical protein
LPGYIASIAINSMIVLAASTVATSSMRVLPVSSTAFPRIDSYHAASPIL